MQMFLRTCVTLTMILWGQGALAQTWVQVEARPNEAQALDRAAAYAAQLPDVNSFRLRSGWYAITLGPYSETEAAAQLSQLRRARVIPSDSFIADGGNYRERIFGSDTALSGSSAAPAPIIELEPGEETVAEARAGERTLTREERELIQIALRWEGVYASTIDASFGPGTRRAMAAWQQANGLEPTGVLTTLQRRDLLDGYTQVLRALNMTPVVNARTGIELTLPAGLVRFDRYEAPFAHYAPATDDGVRVILISQSGGRDTLTAMFDILQTLEIMPLDGPRSLRSTAFELSGANAEIQSHAYAELTGGAVKGFVVVWPAGDEKRFRLALSEMEASFRATEGVLPDTAGSGAQDIDLMSGLEIRRPELSRSGFYVTDDGAVLTTASAVKSCTRITLNDEADAELIASDEALGLALLRPSAALAPISVARLAPSTPRLQSEIAVAGFSFGGILTAPSLTFGTLADVKGLDGNPDVQRLAVASQPGDAGGPVLDGTGMVVGLLQDSAGGARQLPGDVAFSVDALALADFLGLNGVTKAAPAEAGDAMAPEDLTALAADMTVLVSCWN